MSRKTKTPPIRVGDRVRILSPLAFVRCGYPLSFDAVLYRVRKDHSRAVDAFLRSVGVDMTLTRGLTRAYEKVLRAVAYELLRQERHGGKERRIHTRDLPELVGKVAAVVGVRFVKTGDYSPPARGHWGPDDNVPAFLENEQTHRILKLAGQWHDDDPIYGPFGITRDLEVDAANVEKVET